MWAVCDVRHRKSLGVCRLNSKKTKTFNSLKKFAELRTNDNFKLPSPGTHRLNLDNLLELYGLQLSSEQSRLGAQNYSLDFGFHSLANFFVSAICWAVMCLATLSLLSDA